jgi:hypothetical protein
LLSCKTKVINQTFEKKKEGLWIENYANGSANYKSIGNYKNDDPIKKWLYYLDGKIIKKEKFNGNSSKTKLYHENGHIQSKGKTFLDTSAKYPHWYYSGNWNFYDNRGKLILRRYYDSGNLITETILK